ncbi:MAG TPA: hypothetical protein VKZ18_23745 [Polyangia bacterium]|nr:hypothetical protein [Polyangia bacterium]
MMALPSWHVGRLGLPLMLGFLLSPARAVGATDCSGVWRFEVSLLAPEADKYVSAESWCRAAKLPRTFTAQVRSDPNGRTVVTGTPQRPTDLYAVSGRCEFQFPGPDQGSKFSDIKLEVNASGAAVEGTGVCMEHTRESEDKSTGVGVHLSVKGSHLPATGGSIPAPPEAAPASGPPGPDRLAASIVAACMVRDADVLWKMMSSRLRSEVDGRAAQVRSAGEPALRRLYGYKGRLEDFKGAAYLRTTMNGEDSPTNLCWHVKEWEWSPAVPTPAGYVVPVERGDYAMGFTFTKSERGWQLDQMSHWERVPKR